MTISIFSLKKLYKLNPETVFLVPVRDGKRLARSGIKNVYEMKWWDIFSHSDTSFILHPFNIGQSEVF